MLANGEGQALSLCVSLTSKTASVHWRLGKGYRFPDSERSGGKGSTDEVNTFNLRIDCPKESKGTVGYA